ncbi:MAG: hypothetical protein MJ200_00220 [Mycoplasmoidaceae bacterium]|nr:hypothetical protein [Mycoplasmoidaceae bacterium]
MEDDAAGIKDIKIDSFNDSTFTVVSSFKPKNVVPVGHVFMFKLTFYVDYDYESGTAAATIHGSRKYSITYDGDNDYAIDDSKAQKTIDFNNGDYKFAQITGYKAPFYFGEGTGLELKASANGFAAIEIESLEIMNKVESGGYTTFDLGIHTHHMVKVIDDIPNLTISFSLNGIDVLVSTGYTILKTDYISVGTLHNLENYEGKSKLLIEGNTSNFDFLPDDMQIELSINDSQYPNPTSYEITFVGNGAFNIEFY